MPNSNAETRFLEALARLNHISQAINQLGSAERDAGREILRLIVESAVRVVAGSSAVIYTYDAAREIFELETRLSAGIINHYIPPNQIPPADSPRPNGIGWRAIRQKRMVISYEEPDLDVHPAHAVHGVKAVACFPLIVVEQVVGILYIYLCRRREFSRLELLTLVNFVNQAAMAIYHARRLADIQRDLERREEELVRLRHAGLIISSRLRLEETLEAILGLALEVTNAHYGIFRLLDKSHSVLVTRAVAGEHLARPLTENLPLDAPSVMGWVAHHRQPALIPDLRAEPWAQIYYPLDASLEMRSELAIPLINSAGRLEGVLNLESPEVGAFDEEDRRLLQALATYAVIAIQETRLLDALQEIAQRLVTRPAQEVLDYLVQTACELLDTSAGAIWWQHDGRLIVRSVMGLATLSGLEELAKQAYYSGKTAIRHENSDWALAVPLISGSEGISIGAFGVYENAMSRQPSTADWEKKVLTCLSHYATLAIQNERHQEALRLAQEQHAIAETFAAVGDIASNVLHLLNNKVGIIPVRVQNIQQKYLSALDSDSHLLGNLNEIERCAVEAMQTVREHLGHLRPIHLEAVSLEKCLEEALRSIHLPPSVQVERRGLGSLPPVRAGLQTLAFVFTNLLENAAEAMNLTGTIRVDGIAEPNWVKVRVSDEGPGIPPEIQERIFEWNYSTRPSWRGNTLGFGLWWVRTMLTRLGGYIHVESDGHHGTTFHLRLPRYEEK